MPGRTLLRFIAVFGICWWLSSASIVIWPTPTNTEKRTYASVAIKVEGNDVDWDEINGTLIMEGFFSGNIEDVPDPIIARTNPADNRATLEVWMNNKMRYSPKALVIFGEHSENVTHELGVLDYQKYGTNMDAVTCPVVQAGWKTYFELVDILKENNGMLNVSLINDTENPWRALRRGWWIVFFMVTTLLYCLINIGLALRGLLLIKWGRNMPTVCLALEVWSNIYPFANFAWNLTATVHIWATFWFPYELIVYILIIFYWQELCTNTSMEVTLFVTKYRVPVSIIAVILIIGEIITASARSIGKATLPFTLVTSLLYLIIATVTIVYYIYVSVLVFRFLSKITRLRGSHRLLRLVTIRLLSSIVLLLLMMTFGILAVVPAVYNTAVGQNLVQYFVYQIGNSVSLAHILAFEPKSKAVGTSSKSQSKDGESEN